VGLFGRRQRGRHASDDAPREAERDDEHGRESYSGEIYDAGDDTADGYAADEYGDSGEQDAGPYDEDEVPEDGLVRLDLGSVQVPLPANAQIQVEMDPSGPLRAVHIVSTNARYTLSAYASPRSLLLWPEISKGPGCARRPASGAPSWSRS
jgi:hypothetical protein